MIHPRTLDSLEFGKVTAFLASLCVSAAGKKLALAISPYPLPEDAQKEAALYEESRVWTTSSRENFTLTSFPDIGDIFRNQDLRSQKLDLDAFWALREILRLAQRALSSITTQEGAGSWPALVELAQSSPFPDQLLAALNRCMSDDGLLKDESSPELYRLRCEIRQLHQNCLRKVKEFAERYNIIPYLQDEFMTLASDRYVLPLKANFKGRLQGIIHDWSNTGETCYFEPIFLVEINNRLRELKHEEHEEEKRILEYLTSLLDGSYNETSFAIDFLAKLDFLLAKQKFADILDANIINFTPDELGINVEKARHPILALARLDKNPSSIPVRPLDIILRPGERVLVITGGNAGGKTVCLKTMGLASALAMSGMPVPAAKGSHMPWFDRLDAFIGDEQSLNDNVSTFTAQIDHLAKAWKHLNNHGLALLDEFGAGTDPAEGAALAQAVLDGLLEKKCFVLAATHFPALKTYALTKEGVRAASMLFDPETDKPLFRLAYDQVGSSQALAVAALHGLPESILSRARHYLLQDGEDSSKILGRLNNLTAERDAEIAKLRVEQEKAKNLLAEKRASLDKERLRLSEEIRTKATRLMHAWKEEKITAKEAFKSMSGLRKELGLPEEAPSSILPGPDKFVTGQSVFHSGFNKSGIIKDIDERRKRVRIDINGVFLWADMKDVREGANMSPSSPQKSAPVRTTTESASLILDVRGLRAEAAINEVEKFVDKAILAGFSELEIIHGRGTGALRKQIHAYLRSFPAIASISLAPEDRGGDGMTIVTLA